MIALVNITILEKPCSNHRTSTHNKLDAQLKFQEKTQVLVIFEKPPFKTLALLDFDVQFILFTHSNLLIN